MKWGLLVVCVWGQVHQTGVMENLVSIFVNGGFQAGGALLRSNLVLTSATHTEFHESLIKVGLFSDTRLENRQKGLFDVQSIHRHPLFNDTNRYYYNLALFKIKGDHAAVQGCTIDDGAETRSQFILVGWGTIIDVWGWPVETLHTLPISSFDSKACGVLMGTNIHPTELCAGQTKGNVDAAFVAVGSPLFSLQLSGPVLVGIYSRTGPSTQFPGDYSPVAFVKMSAFYSWIHKMMICLEEDDLTKCPKFNT
ncbi:Kallikrein-7 [Entomophthora muscae]|uniref:Kallikrein-7 n=1 Tax=Entomophthora muscae TaxID=34485 RepID=A0ACC2TXB2_9FUNG|nr:Kallikrein-7 [Entomophthora muscae]